MFKVKCSQFISVGVTLKFNVFTGIIQFKCQCGKPDFLNRSKLYYCSSYLGLRQFLQWTSLMRLSYCFLLTPFLHSYVYCEIYLLNITRDIPKTTYSTIQTRVNNEHVLSYVTLTLFYTTVRNEPFIKLEPSFLSVFCEAGLFLKINCDFFLKVVNFKI